MFLFARFSHAWPSAPVTPVQFSKHLAMLAGSLILFHTAAFADTVFSSDFSDPNNFGTIGGSLLNPSASDVNINQGPWMGTYQGLLGVLLPPQLQISSGAATISGIAGVNVAELVDNAGWFYQDTGSSYANNTTYTLTADVASGSLLSASILSNDGVGIGLTAGGDSLVGASTDPGALLSVSLLSGDVYQLSYQFLTGGTAPSGDIGIRLFDEPSGLATASLLPSVTFSNVSLDASQTGSAVPEPASLALTGAGLLAMGVYTRKRRQGTN